MILEAFLTLHIDGKNHKVSANVYDKAYRISVNGYSVGRILQVAGKWECGSKSLNPYADYIINQFATVRKKCKWNLPENLRSKILWGRYDIDNDSLVCAIVDNISFGWFEAELKAALKANNIQPNILIRLHQPRIIRYYDKDFLI